MCRKLGVKLWPNYRRAAQELALKASARWPELAQPAAAGAQAATGLTVAAGLAAATGEALQKRLAEIARFDGAKDVCAGGSSGAAAAPSPPRQRPQLTPAAPVPPAAAGLLQIERFLSSGKEEEAGETETRVRALMQLRGVSPSTLHPQP